MNPKPKNQLRCYHCKNTFPHKDGEWHHWAQMQVFLCKTCNQATLGRPERAGRTGPAPAKKGF